MKTKMTDERISMRTNAETKRFLAAAAMLSGYNSLSSFILSTIHREAQRILHESQTRVLSKSDMELVVSLLKNPPEPNKKLIAIMRDATKRYADTPESEFYI